MSAASLAEAVTPRLLDLAARLRAAGARCGVDEVVVAHRALAEVGVSRSETRAALRATLCTCPAELEVFDAAFDELFARAAPLPSPDLPTRPNDLDPRMGSPNPPRGRPDASDAANGGVDRAALTVGAAADAGEPPLASPARWSQIELLRDKDFRAYDVDDHALARAALRALAAQRPLRRSARLRRGRGRPVRPDLARTLRSSLEHGGDPAEIVWLARAQRPRRTVFVCDVSGSMGPYAAALLQYVHASVHSGRAVEAFCFATRLERVTLELSARDADRAIARVEAHVPDRSGGTRIGDAIGQLNRRFGGQVGRGAVVVILSDGWDRGDAGVLGRELARLRRTARRVLWLDPHAGAAGYEPLTRGMREALPHTDRLLPAGNLRALEQLAAALRAG